MIKHVPAVSAVASRELCISTFMRTVQPPSTIFELQMSR
jgi:hypothetical protein